MKQYTATANDEGVRLSRFVQSVTRDFPTSLLYKSFRNKRIKVNGKKGVPEDRIKAGDTEGYKEALKHHFDLYKDYLKRTRTDAEGLIREIIEAAL